MAPSPLAAVPSDADPPTADERRGDENLAAISALAAEGASGELVIASDTLEAHVFLLDGRIAWATNTRAPNHLTRYLREVCRLDEGALCRVVESCRASGQPFGEALVEQGLATEAQLRDALSAQIEASLGALATLDACERVFLPARLSYDPRFTFETSILLDGLFGGAPSAEGEDLDLVETTLASVPDASWVDLAEPTRVLVRGTAKLNPPDHDLSLRLDGMSRELEAESVIVRSGHGFVAGARVPDRAVTLWCGSPARARLGFASAALDAIMARRRAGLSRSSRTRSQVAFDWAVFAAGGPPEVLATLESACRASSELLAAFVFDPGAERAIGLARAPAPPQMLVAEARKSARLLLLDVDQAVADPGERQPGFEPLAAHVRLAERSVYLTSLHGLEPFVLSLVLRRSSPKGLGWTLLDALARHLKDHAARP